MGVLALVHLFAGGEVVDIHNPLRLETTVPSSLRQTAYKPGRRFQSDLHNCIEYLGRTLADIPGGMIDRANSMTLPELSSLLKRET